MAIPTSPFTAVIVRGSRLVMSAHTYTAADDGPQTVRSLVKKFEGDSGMLADSVEIVSPDQYTRLTIKVAGRCMNCGGPILETESHKVFYDGVRLHDDGDCPAEA